MSRALHSHGHGGVRTVAGMHAALVYSSDDEFLSLATPYIQEGLHADEQVLVVTTGTNIELLRDRLDDHAAGVDFIDSSVWYSSPANTLFAYDQYVHDQEQRTRPVRILGEPPWEDRSPLRRRAWQRYESLLNLAFADRDMSCVCPYDTRVVEPSVLASARRTHPTLITIDAEQPSTDYAEPAEFCAECDDTPLPAPPGPISEREFDAAALKSAREFVTWVADQAGLPSPRVSELVTAVNEITTNAVRHGGGRGRLRTWREDHCLVFEVDDSGRSRPDPLAGHLRPPADPHRSGGYGLWLARQLCDLVEVRDGPGWLVRLYAEVE